MNVGRIVREFILMPVATAASISGFVVLLLSYWLGSAATVSTQMYLGSIAGALFVPTYIAWLSTFIKPPAQFSSPSLIKVRKDENYGLILLFSPAPWVSMNSTYSLYVKEDEFEILLAGVRVLSIHEDDKRVQVSPLLPVPEGNDKIWDVLATNNADTAKKVLLKVGAPNNV